MGDYTRFTMSTPRWWLRQMKQVAKTQGVSLSAIIRLTCTQAWRLEPEDETDQDGDDDDEG